MTEERKDRRHENPERAAASDRRDSPRLLMNFEIRSPETEGFIACSGDVSLGGAFYLAKEPPLPGVLEVRVQIPDCALGKGASVTCRADVVRTHRNSDGTWGVHLAFLGLSLEDEQVLARFIDSYLQEKQTKAAITE